MLLLPVALWEKASSSADWSMIQFRQPQMAA